MITLRALGALATLVLTAACSQPNEGALQAQPGPGVTLGKRSITADTAEISRAGLYARIWGDWGQDAGETIDIEYRNTRNTAVSIRVDQVRISFKGQQGAVEQISDVSRLNLDDADHNNDTGRSLMGDAESPDSPGILAIPAHEMRRIQVSFMPFSEPDRPRVDNVVTLTVPLSDSVVSVPLKCAGP